MSSSAPPISTMTTRPPDGGYGWVVATSSACIMFLRPSFVAVFGVVYIDLVDYYNTSKTMVSWLAAVQQLIMGISGLIYGPLVHRFGARRVGILCPLLVVLGYFTTSLSPQVAPLFFTYSILLGFGFGAYEAVCIPAVLQWFSKNKSLVLSFNLVGSSLGTFTWPPLATILVQEYSWKGGFIIVAGIQMQTIVCMALLRPPAQCKQLSDTRMLGLDKHENKLQPTSHGDKGHLKSPTKLTTLCSWLVLFKQPSFTFTALGIFFLYTNNIVTYGYTTTRGLLLGFSKTQSALLSSFVGAGNMCGRAIAGLVSTKVVSKWHVHICGLFTLIAGLLTIGSIASDAYWFLCVYSIIWGVAAGFYILYMYSVSGVVSMFDPTYNAEVYLFYLAMCGFAYFLTNIVAGMILDVTNEPKVLFCASGGAQCLGALFFFVAICLHKQWPAESSES